MCRRSSRLWAIARKLPCWSRCVPSLLSTLLDVSICLCVLFRHPFLRLVCPDALIL